jgi:hypothetical protein
MWIYLCAVGIGIGLYVYKYQQSQRKQQVKNILHQYMPLDEEVDSSHEGVLL